ncbi:hypothetical protein [Nocardia rhizosphaerae]|uniref:Uncharacterized protein n=1 Tax=Nocardia rhizosphaerae TaxID=1691571 RepID=A0ABV8LDL3_9NOCA
MIGGLSLLLAKIVGELAIDLVVGIGARSRISACAWCRQRMISLATSPGSIPRMTELKVIAVGIPLLSTVTEMPPPLRVAWAETADIALFNCM